MITEKQIELIHREIDKLNSAEESRAFQEMLSVNPEVKELYDELHTLSGMLNSVQPVEPSPNLKKLVLNSIDAGRYASPAQSSFLSLFKPSLSNSHTPINPQEGFMKSKLVISGVLVAVIAVVYMSFIYPWPATNDVTGTIGGVKKYNSQQISDRDVQLNEHALTDGAQADPEVVMAFWKSQPLSMRETFAKDVNASLTKDANASLTKDANASLTKDANASLTKDANASLAKGEPITMQKGEPITMQKGEGNTIQKGEPITMQKGEGNTIQKTTELAMAIAFWNTASIAQKQEFYKTFNDLQKGEGNTIQKGEGNTFQKGEGNTIQKGEGNTIQKGEANTIQKGEGNTIQKTAGNEVQKTADHDQQ